MSRTKGLRSETPQLEAEDITLLERLSNACAVSGDEHEVRTIVKEALEAHIDDMQVDALGNILVVKKSKRKNPLKVMLAAHMDEVGFMIVSDEGNGIYRFETIGGIDERKLPGKVVSIGSNHVPGVIGTCPIHFLKAEDLERKIPLDGLRIDIGVTEKSEKVKLGDRATFATKFKKEGERLFGKALDNRFGVATLIKLIKNAPPDIELQAAFTVQEEVGLRGAKVAAYALKPDLAFAIDCTPAYDMPQWWEGEENNRYNTRLGKGPAIYIADRGTLSDPRLVRLVTETAQACSIPYQIRQPGGGGTDAAAIHLQREGIPSISISVPGRYAHTGLMLARFEDWQHYLSLIYNTLCRIDKKILERS